MLCLTHRPEPRPEALLIRSNEEEFRKVIHAESFEHFPNVESFRESIKYFVLSFSFYFG